MKATDIIKGKVRIKGKGKIIDESYTNIANIKIANYDKCLTVSNFICDAVNKELINDKSENLYSLIIIDHRGKTFICNYLFLTSMSANNYAKTFTEKTIKEYYPHTNGSNFKVLINKHELKTNN